MDGLALVDVFCVSWYYQLFDCRLLRAMDINVSTKLIFERMRYDYMPLGIYTFRSYDLLLFRAFVERPNTTDVDH